MLRYGADIPRAIAAPVSRCAPGIPDCAGVVIAACQDRCRRAAQGFGAWGTGISVAVQKFGSDALCGRGAALSLPAVVHISTGVLSRDPSGPVSPCCAFVSLRGCQDRCHRAAPVFRSHAPGQRNRFKSWCSALLPPSLSRRRAGLVPPSEGSVTGEASGTCIAARVGW
jgi:hypothetical protein